MFFAAKGSLNRAKSWTRRSMPTWERTSGSAKSLKARTVIWSDGVVECWSSGTASLPRAAALTPDPSPIPRPSSDFGPVKNGRGEPLARTGPAGMMEWWSGGTMAFAATGEESGVDFGLLRLEKAGLRRGWKLLPTGMSALPEDAATAGVDGGERESPREGTRPTVEAARSRAASEEKNQSSSARSSGAGSTGKLMQGM